MIIDFHTHIFPDELAPKAIAKLLSNIDGAYTLASDGTLSGLLKNMDDWKIDLSVLQPVITKASQVRKTNEWVKGVCDCGKVVGFGGIFPHSDDYKSDIDFVCDLGLKGLKFHAEYQDFIVDDLRMLDIYYYALSKDLILLHHAGFDPGFPPPFKSSPQRFANVCREMGGGIIIAAHLGGHGQWDDVYEHLAGSNIYLDTSMGFEFFDNDLFLKLVQKHGADKILFASDSPWSNAKSEINHLMSLPLTEAEKTAILGSNAHRILNQN